MTSNAAISFTVSYRGTPHALSLLPDSTIAVLQAQLEALTDVPPALQKLLYKGRNLLGTTALNRDEITITQAGFKSGFKVQMLGSTSQELAALHSTESDQRKRDRILKERALKAPTKVCILRSVVCW